jgi:hypothetical protein
MSDDTHGVLHMPRSLKRNHCDAERGRLARGDQLCGAETVAGDFAHALREWLSVSTTWPATLCGNARIIFEESGACAEPVKFAAEWPLEETVILSRLCSKAPNLCTSDFPGTAMY